MVLWTACVPWYLLCLFTTRSAFLRYYTLNVRSRGKQFCFPESPDVSRDWFPDWPDIKCFVIFLDFKFNVLQQQLKNHFSGANQNSWLGTYNNTNLILKTTTWMIYKVLSLYYLHLFLPLAAVSLLRQLWKSLLFSLRLHVCVFVFIHEKENWQRFTPLSVTPLSTMLNDHVL